MASLGRTAQPKTLVRTLFHLAAAVHASLATRPVEPLQNGGQQGAIVPVGQVIQQDPRRIIVFDGLDPADESTMSSFVSAPVDAFYTHFQTLKHGDPQEKV